MSLNVIGFDAFGFHYIQEEIVKICVMDPERVGCIDDGPRQLKVYSRKKDGRKEISRFWNSVLAGRIGHNIV